MSVSPEITYLLELRRNEAVLAVDVRYLVRVVPDFNLTTNGLQVRIIIAHLFMKCVIL